MKLPDSLSQPERLWFRIIGPIMRLFFRLLYREFAWTYDWVAAVVSLGLWKDWVRSVLPFITGPAILELGHGPGHLQKALHQVGLHPVGVDRSRQMGKIARQKLTNKSQTSHLAQSHAQTLAGFLVRGDSGTLPFGTESFDQIVATFPSEYIAQASTLDEIARVLTPTGELVILSMAVLTGASLPHRMANWLFRITGQGDAVRPYLNFFEGALQTRGFSPKVSKIAVKHSEVTVLIAAKQPKPPGWR